MKSPAYQWYPKDILSSERVAFLTLAEEGAYRRAMDYCWLQGSIPADPAKLSVLIGKKCTPKTAAAIIHLFIQHPEKPDRLIHDKQEVQRADQQAFREKQSGIAKQRWLPKSIPPDSHGIPMEVPPDESGNALHSATASATAKKEKIIKKNPSDGWDYNPGPDTGVVLEEIEIGGTVQWVVALRQITLDQSRIIELWTAFKLKLDGKKFYQSRSDLVQHFRNWLKDQDLDSKQSTNRTKMVN